MRSVFSRPAKSDIHPDKTRPEALPIAPTVSANAAAAAECPALRANGTSWLMIIVPAVVPRQNAIHRIQNVRVRTISEAGTSTPLLAAARTFDGFHPGGR